ncbi:hypothetical protein H312_01729 [Anncaliia algerae PRA339]|uniref:CCHC-type domain-containing protein n=1 Tax=Anncaliia algerae PRA339 TaxID=1288291 RepID=A0A059F1J0_9MICR|nr:hypothetical protein H312_01729 [Anncaliia algerae PRA339]
MKKCLKQELDRTGKIWIFFFKILREGLGLGRIEDDCWILFENHKEAGIKFEVTKEQLIKYLPSDISERIFKTTSWKKLVQEGYILDKEYRKNKRIESMDIKEKNNTYHENILSKKNLKLKCLYCEKRGHIKKDC